MASKKWIFTERRKQALKKAQRVHVELVEAGKKTQGYHSTAKRVRVARNVRN